MLLEDKQEHELAHDINSAAQIMQVYCERYFEESRPISILMVQVEYIVSLAKALCKKY